MNSAIAFAGVSRRFANGTRALADTSFSVGAGEFVSLLGPSGCGKSTVLRIAAGLMVPDVGSVSVGEASGGTDRQIGFVFQEPTLMPWARVFDNVWLPLRLQGMSADAARARVEEALELVGLADFARVYPRELSGGMKMRVSIARALVTRPNILLMDEPFAALDELSRGKLNDDLLALWREFGFTVLFVTHSVYESVYLSQRVLVMSARPGRVVADVPVEQGAARNDEFRLSAPYATACRSVSAALKASDAAGPPLPHAQTHA